MKLSPPYVARYYVHEASPADFIGFVREWMDDLDPPLSQRYLAREIGVQPQHMSKWMQGKVAPKPTSRKRILDGLHRIQLREES